MNKKTLSLALAGVFAMQPVYAEKTPQAELDILSAESDEAAAEKNQEAPTSTAAEPDVEAVSDTETEKLSDAVTAQLSKILGESSGDSIDAETEDQIEKVISSSLLGGADIKDIRSAVNSAMTEIKTAEGSTISEEKLANVTKSIDKLVGSEEKTEVAEDSYLSSLRAEADEVDKPAFKETPVTAQPAKVVEAEEEEPVKVAAKVTPSTVSEAQVDLEAESVTVLKGESLYKIALRVYGNGSMYARLYEANKETVIDPNMITVGQVLKVPR